MVYFVPSAAAAAFAFHPEHEVAGAELVFINGHILAVMCLICGTASEVCAEIGINFVDRPIDEPRTIKLIIALCAEHIRCAEFCHSRANDLRPFFIGKKVEYLVYIRIAGYVHSEKLCVILAVFGLHHLVQHFALVIVEVVEIGALAVVECRKPNIAGQRYRTVAC